MTTNPAIDEELPEEAMHVGGFHTKKETVNTSLAEFINNRRKKDMLNLAGTVSFREDYDYKVERSKDAKRISDLS